ncbi:MAG: hypothetical protein KJ737_25140 [Proteobacteria bacterium]|nr:hypothetical protein [Pseudomonadota bacterium]
MFNKNQICSKINELYPDLGVCGKDIQISFDNDNHAWVVDLKKDVRHLKTFIEISDAEACIDNGRCLGMVFQITQLKENISSISH